MPPRAPIIWSSPSATRADRVRRRLDERHRDLTREARSLGQRYRGTREARSGDAVRHRIDFLAALGRLSAFENASIGLGRCRFELQVAAYADDLSRDYFKLWQMLARAGGPTEEEGSAERLDHFAVQLGRLEGMADALAIAGRNVRLFPPPQISWMPVAAG